MGYLISRCSFLCGLPKCSISPILSNVSQYHRVHPSGVKCSSMDPPRVAALAQDLLQQRTPWTAASFRTQFCCAVDSFTEFKWGYALGLECPLAFALLHSSLPLLLCSIFSLFLNTIAQHDSLDHSLDHFWLSLGLFWSQVALALSWHGATAGLFLQHPPCCQSFPT